MRGTGVFGFAISLFALASWPTAASAASKKASVERSGFTLAFVDADVRRVADAVLGSMMGVDYDVDPAVQGNLTLRTNQPVAGSELLSILEQGLRSVNAVIIVQDGRYHVLTREAARNRAALVQPTSTPLNAQTASKAEPATVTSPGYASEAIVIEKGSTREIARLLTQFLGKEIVSSVDLGRNQIIVSGSGEERQAARDLIVRFDTDTLAEMNFELFRLENVDADTLLAELERIFAPPYDIIGSRVRLISLPRLRSLLAIAADRTDFARIAPWIQRLDAGGAGKRKLYSYHVQNGRARDLARTLQMVLGASGSSMVSPAGAVSGTVDQGGLTSPGEGSSTGAGSVPSIEGSGTTGVGGGTAPRVVPNEENNSLLIFANGEEYEFIRDALEKVDRPVSEVLIEATLAEVTLSNDLRYGVDWSVVKGGSSFTQSTNKGGVPASVFPGFSYSYINSTATAVLNSLQSKTNVRVLSTPKLIVLNNQTATLQVGDQVPIVTQQQQGVLAPGAPLVNTIEMRDTGVILKVTPRVNESGLITLDISQEVSDVAPTTTSGISSPTIQQRRLSTTVSTRSGEMIAMGGLIRDRATRSRSGIPVISQVPVIGALFGSHSNDGSRTELIMLLTPTVIRSPQEVRGIADDLINRLDTLQPLLKRAEKVQVGKPTPAQ